MTERTKPDDRLKRLRQKKDGLIFLLFDDVVAESLESGDLERAETILRRLKGRLKKAFDTKPEKAYF